MPSILAEPPVFVDGYAHCSVAYKMIRVDQRSSDSPPKPMFRRRPRTDAVLPGVQPAVDRAEVQAVLRALRVLHELRRLLLIFRAIVAGLLIVSDAEPFGGAKKGAVLLIEPVSGSIFAVGVDRSITVAVRKLPSEPRATASGGRLLCSYSSS